MKKLIQLLILLICISTPTFAQEHGMGCEFDYDVEVNVPQKAPLLTRDIEILPSSYSLKQYAPIPKSQGQYGTCTSWATSYCARTICESIINGWTDKGKITQEAYSPMFVYKQIQSLPNCKEGSRIDLALEILKTKGAPKFSSFGMLCVDLIPQHLFREAIQHKIDDYNLLFIERTDSRRRIIHSVANNVKIRKIKKALCENRPVVMAIETHPSFHQNGQEVWSGTLSNIDTIGWHALCVVGYDDNKYGGAFEIQNSWGTDWGNQGYIWMRYNDFCNVCGYAYEVYKKKTIPQKLHSFAGDMYIEEKDGKGHMSLSLKTDGAINYYKANEAHLSGSKFRLYVSNNEPAWVYVIASDKQNNVAKLFPYSDRISANLNYRSNNIALPDETHEFKLDNTVGTDYFCVLYSGEELDINSIVRNIQNTPGNFYQKVSSVLSGKLAVNTDIKYTASQMKFSAQTNGTVVPLIIEIDHK